MEGSPHDLLALLRARRDTAAELSHHAGEVGVAVHEVLAELTRRAQVIADQYPEEETVNPRLIVDMPVVVDALSALVDTLSALDTLISEWADIVGPRREAMVKLLDRMRSEGFTVANDWEITDTHTWTPLEDDADPELLVQREAEKTVRAERATAYRERIARMGTAFEETQTHYTQQVRDLIPTVLDG
ncbi:hypothetical protein [Mycobacteroides abscessus]|uniref:hypothetical protein n=1 Tax=Mycobacteroides abscessus TaxID=36809 RepID=UPI00092AD01C|nr:hypothetical protein [Mycobacteroides abscessus]SIJ34886.1 Uncharacterised protein [Mycobacteroides abscessus subsp. abscessus]SIK91784.1 Uncharacterised protein [Mycobacteroides abscessus subsp. abscessus]SIL98885.1 Uncharacterised protein [Mycobacteroides abscessus subsp. abscessus]SLE80819.1 Uncharacterised protein [Mycobacteroides abscessus subsp. abscessus]